MLYDDLGITLRFFSSGFLEVNGQWLGLIARFKNLSVGMPY